MILSSLLLLWYYGIINIIYGVTTLCDDTIIDHFVVIIIGITG